ALICATAAFTLGDLDDQRADLARRHDVARALEDAVAAAGGAERLRACGAVRTGPDQRSTVARAVGVPVVGSPRPGDVAIALRPDGTWSIRGCP
nr:hypothetical protein [Thermoleophilaceae bacterium]